MNAARRKALEAVKAELNESLGSLESVKSQLEDLAAEEQEYYDNMPESFQNGEKGERAQAAIAAIEAAIEKMDEMIGSAEEVESSIDEAVGA